MTPPCTKSAASWWLALLLTAAAMGLPLLAEDDPASPALNPATLADDRYEPGSPLAYRSSPQVRIDVLMVALPEERALTLLPQLRDPTKVEAAQAALLASIARQEGRLLDWPEVTIHSEDRRAEADFITEYTIPVDFDEEPSASCFPEPSKKPPPLTAAQTALGLLRMTGLIRPESFETRNTGTTLEAVVNISPDTKSVQLVLWPEYVLRLPEYQFIVAKPEHDPPITVTYPRFFTAKAQFSGTLRDGERRLIYFCKQPLTGEILLFLAGAQVLPALNTP